MRKPVIAIAFMLLTCACSAAGSTELKENFSYGINYAWKNYAGDFGGIAAWGKKGVAADPAAYAAEMQEMAAHGVKVVRWWVWPEFWTDAITFSADGSPGVLGQQAIDDGLKALELANDAGIRIMFCLFSFDGFRPTRQSYGITMTGYHDIVTDNARRAALMVNVVTPFARALQQSPHLDSLHSWDIINEPEWAVTGENKYGGTHGGDQFDPDDELQVITHDQMEIFIADTIAVLRKETPDIPVSVGSAAVKWASAWSELDVDFYQTHIYDWVNDYWPYNASPADFGLDDKPLIMGEYPVEGLNGVDHTAMLESWYSNGYAGALGWDYRITHSPGLGDAPLAAKRGDYLSELKDFAESTINPADTSIEPALSAARKVPLSRPSAPSIAFK